MPTLPWLLDLKTVSERCPFTFGGLARAAGYLTDFKWKQRGSWFRLLIAAWTSKIGVKSGGEHPGVKTGLPGSSDEPGCLQMSGHAASRQWLPEG